MTDQPNDPRSDSTKLIEQDEQIAALLQDIVALRTQLAVLLEEKVERENRATYNAFGSLAGTLRRKLLPELYTPTDLTNEPANVAGSSVIYTTDSEKTDETGKR